MNRWFRNCTQIFHRPKWQILIPFRILQRVKSLPFHISEAWKRYPFRAEPPYIKYVPPPPPRKSLTRGLTELCALFCLRHVKLVSQIICFVQIIDKWIKLTDQTPKVCFGAKHDQFGRFWIPFTGLLVRVKLVHLYGDTVWAEVETMVLLGMRMGEDQYSDNEFVSFHLAASQWNRIQSPRLPNSRILSKIPRVDLSRYSASFASSFTPRDAYLE